MSKLYLENIQIESFGKFIGKSITGLQPGLNIIYGENEAGKSTIATFIKSVLIGWPTKNVSKKIVNTYNNNLRSGFLTFSGDETIVVKRNEKEFTGNKKVIQIPDKENFETMYALTSDSLWDLGKGEKEISAKFLTAETGTNISPADALSQTENELKAFDSNNKIHQDKSIRYCEDRINYYKNLISQERKINKVDVSNLKKEKQIAEDNAKKLNKEIESLIEKRATKLPKNIFMFVALFLLLIGLGTLYFNPVLGAVLEAIAVVFFIIFFIIQRKHKSNNIENILQEKRGELARINKFVEALNYKIISAETEQKISSPQKSYEVEKSIWEQKKNDLIKEYFIVLARKQILKEAIKNWEKNSQPQFYKDASRYMSIMTKGKWNNINVVDNVLYVNDTKPELLSLSTRQQLYLSLRIAILIRPESEGTNIPIICDDILVNFDEERRKGAIKALQELANHKQVIMFTCHKEIVKDLDYIKL